MSHVCFVLMVEVRRRSTEHSVPPARRFGIAVVMALYTLAVLTRISCSSVFSTKDHVAPVGPFLFK